MRAAAAGALTVVVVAVAAGGDGAGAQDRKPCDYGSHRPTPLRIGTLPAEVVPGRRVAYQVIARGYRGRLFGRGLTRLTIRFEQVDDGEETFSADRLRAYKRSKPGDNIGYDVRLLADSPGERVIVSWTDAGGSTPCTGELRSGDVRVAADRRPQRAVISSRAGVTDARRGDSSQLRISGRTRGCALTDPTRLTVVASAFTKSSSWLRGPALEDAVAVALVGGHHRVAVVPVEARLGVQPERAAGACSADRGEDLGVRLAAVGARVAEHDHRRARVAGRPRPCSRNSSQTRP
jgi:hypothetical protein